MTPGPEWEHRPWKARMASSFVRVRADARIDDMYLSQPWVIRSTPCRLKG